MIFHYKKRCNRKDKHQKEKCHDKHQAHLLNWIKCEEVLSLTNEQVHQKLHISFKKHQEESWPQSKRSEKYWNFVIERE